MDLANHAKYLAKRLSNVHRPTPGGDIYMFGTARSGSTIIAESLLTQRGVKLCDEPLDLREEEKRRELGMADWGGLLPGPDRERLLRRYFERIERNMIPLFNPNPFGPYRAFYSTRIAYKLLHGCKDMINWFRDELDGHVLAFLRHPIPVTLSRRQYPNLPYYLRNEQYRAHFTPEQIALAERVIAGDDDFAQGVVDWCLQNKPMLDCPDKRGWLLMTYEEFVLNTSDATDLMARRYGLTRPDLMCRHAQRPSLTVRLSARDTQEFFRQGLNRSDPWWLITKWRPKVTRAQEEAAWDIVEAFGIDVYPRGAVLPRPEYVAGGTLARWEGEPVAENAA